MTEREHFASLILASHIGIMDKKDVVSEADQRIAEVQRPDHWLIEVAIDGSSTELSGLIDDANDSVYGAVLRLAFESWVTGKMSDERFVECCRNLWKKAGQRSKWYYDLVWVDDEFDLVAQGVFRREDSVKKIRDAIERILKR